MLIWINGAFGSGKTQTAHELQRRLQRAHVVDPEPLGLALRKMLPAQSREDFQDLPQWRSGVLTTLVQAEMSVDGPVIVPMTIVRDDYFDQIIGGLRAQGIDLRHYSLVATPATLRRRLRRRSGYMLARLTGRDETWALQQIDRCVDVLDGERYASQIATDERPIDEVVETIALDAGLTLTRPRLSAAGYQARRLMVGVRHIRL
jgi:AAA domain